MAYLKVECSVARNRKFVKAGPAPSWLWICGLAYCQEGLTDGFIPFEALPYLGVKNAKQLAVHLVKAGLWDEQPGGWCVHDYLEHNKSAADVEGIRSDRRDAGARGGVASGAARRRTKHTAEANVKQPAEATAKQVSNPLVAVVDAVAVADGVFERTEGIDFRADVALQQLQAAYPQHRVTRNVLTEQAFWAAVSEFPDGPAVAFAVMLENLHANIRSHEWRVRGYIPKLEKYLREGLWQNVLPPDAPAGDQISAKTMRMLA